MHYGFERKSSLLTLQEDRGDFDILYLRNKDKWYLGKLKGIGTNINHSLSFFKKKLKNMIKLFLQEAVLVRMRVCCLEVYYK